MHGERVNGMSLFDVRAAAERLVPEVRSTSRPVFVEALTYRYRGHGAADPGDYRTKEEIEEWRQKDPIGEVEQRLLDNKVLTEEDVERIQEEIRKRVQESLKFADESPFPELDELDQHIYA